MNSIFEKITAYVLGGAAGYVLNIVLATFEIPVFKDTNIEMGVVSIGVGVLISIVYMEYKNQVLLKNNTIIRNETVALISHELRTSLTSSGWIMGLILKKYESHLEESDKKMLQNIVDSIPTTVMHSVNLLDVGLLDIKKIAIALERVTLDKVELMFNEVLEKYTIGAKEQGIELAASVTLDYKRVVEVDLLRLKIVIENLIENAIQYTTTSAEKRIIVKITNKNESMNIEIRDTGAGIPENEQSKIFTEFYRASNARKMLNTGSGIGLYTCMKYVNAHRGTITFESKEGEGSVFFVTIPLKTVADVEGFIASV